MPLSIRPMDEANARAIADWRYEAPYDLYNVNPDEIDREVEYLVDPHNACYGITDERGNLVGYCSFGLDGQVPGGDYGEKALDIGMGIRPDLTGQGNGAWYGELVLGFAQRTFAPDRFRVTVAEFNQRAQRVWQKLNFRVVRRFLRDPDGLPFFILMREA